MKRLTFLAWFVQVLALAGASFFGWKLGVFQTVWANDASYMTSAIAALVVATALWLGWQSWRADDGPVYIGLDAYGRRIESSSASSDWGHEAQVIAPSLGTIGTVLGLSMQAKVLAAGIAGLGALSTSLFTTGAGLAGYVILKVMTYSLDQGIKRK